MGNVVQKHDNVVIEDIANENEPIPIKVINNENEAYPFLFSYGTKYKLSKEVSKLMYKPTPSDGCACDGECNSESCQCEAGSTVNFNTVSRQVETYIDAFTCGDHRYIECGPHCRCRGNCKRQLSRDTIMKALEVRYKPDLGYTVTACQHIAAGMPIMNYIGDVITQEDLEGDYDATNGTDYMFNFYNEGNFKIHCDAAAYGNVSRFMSHSCDPNAYLLKSYPCAVFEDSKIVLPKLVVIALRSIIPGDEITIFYGSAYFRERNIPCLCGTIFCSVPPEKSKNDSRKTLLDVKRERADRRRQVEDNAHDTGDLHDK